ncbi:MAG: ribonuclease P protein component [Candidatus Bipolaricaulota bacterium]
MSHNSFTKENRLKTEKDFSRVYRDGRRFEGDFFVFYLLEKEEGKPRIGIVTPKGIGSAVERNRVKRIIRESFRKNKGIFDSYDFIVKPQKEVIDFNNPVLAERFREDFPAH